MYEKENLYRNNPSSIKHRCWRSLAALGYRTFCAGREAAMKVLDLFSGIGGFSLGLERAGMKTVAFCEIDPFCREVLKKHWPDVPIYEDIKEVEYVEADIVCGGDPCQPHSVAGKRRGQEDDRYLWPEMFRVIRATRPDWVINENVAGSISNGVFDAKISDLEAEGYTAGAFNIPACGVGAWHRRERIWIVAHASSKGQGWAKWEREAREKGSSEGYGAKFNWRIPAPRTCRGSDGIPKRMDRVKSLGNAVIPQIPEMIGRAIMGIELA